jgi:hypothetical protein
MRRCVRNALCDCAASATQERYREKEIERERDKEREGHCDSSQYTTESKAEREIDVREQRLLERTPAFASGICPPVNIHTQTARDRERQTNREREHIYRERERVRFVIGDSDALSFGHAFLRAFQKPHSVQLRQRVSLELCTHTSAHARRRESERPRHRYTERHGSSTL